MLRAAAARAVVPPTARVRCLRLAGGWGARCRARPGLSADLSARPASHIRDVLAPAFHGPASGEHEQTCHQQQPMSHRLSLLHRLAALNADLVVQLTASRHKFHAGKFHCSAFDACKFISRPYRTASRRRVPAADGWVCSGPLGASRRDRARRHGYKKLPLNPTHEIYHGYKRGHLALCISCIFVSASMQQEVPTHAPPPGSLATGRIVLVDDGSCPPGEVLELTGSTPGLDRQSRCVPRPTR